MSATRFFRSLFGCRLSLLRSVSLEGDFEKRFLRSRLGVVEFPDVIVVVTPCSEVRKLSLSVDGGAFSRLLFLTSDSLVSGTGFKVPEVSIAGVVGAALVGERAAVLDWTSLVDGDDDRAAGVMGPLVAESAFLNRAEARPGDF